MTDKTLDGNYWGPGRPARPSNGGQVLPVGPVTWDSFGHPLPGADRVAPMPGGMPGMGIFPVDKDPSPRDR
jgi:hypothetical protein